VKMGQQSRGEFLTHVWTVNNSTAPW